MRSRFLLAGFLLLLSASAASTRSGAQTAGPAKEAPREPMRVATASLPAPAPRDVKAAVDAYLAKVPPEKKARSDAYFEGGYWLILWDFLYAAAVLILLLQAGWSARLRDWAERMTPRKPLQTVLYFVPFLIVFSLLTFPLTVYEGFFREHQYGLATDTFGQWLRDQVVGLAVGLVAGSILATPLFGLVRRLERTWWVWGAVTAVVFYAFLELIAPVYVAPLFNKYTTLQDPKIKNSILSMARANGIPATEVYEVDASRRTTRVGAYVFGFLGTERITLNDNLLKRCSPEEIQSVMGHEMGHYVLHHAYKGLLFFGVEIVVAFAYLNWALGWSLGRWGQKWGVRGITDVAVLPLAALLLLVFFFVFTPVSNTSSRVQEYEADLYGINASQQPDGEAEVDLKLGEYRKLDPGPIEEFLFFDHPSGRTRITAAMRWKAEHLPGAPLGPAPVQPNSGPLRR